MAPQFMGEPAVSAFLQSVLRDLPSIIGMGHTWFLDFNPELKEMEKVLSRFQDVLGDGEKRRLTEKSVDKWMDDLKDLLYNADDILDEINIERQQLEETSKSQPDNIQVSNNFSSVYSRSNSIKIRICNVLDRINDLAQEADQYLKLRRDGVYHANWGTFQAMLRPETGPSVDDSEIHGREEDKENIINLLLAGDGPSKRNYDVNCIVGMGGLGKTTLAQLVFKDQRVEGFFDVRSWVCVSDVFDVRKATIELIEYVAQVDGISNLQSLAAVQARLVSIINGKRFLFVLDDVWTTKEWDRLKAPLNFGATGSKIIVTTRLKKVADAISNKAPYQLGLLHYDQCLAIFKDKAFTEIDEDANREELMTIGKGIVKKCGGLPLAVKVIGAMLRGAEEERWRAILQNELWHSAYANDAIHPALRLSYYYLPAFLKRCFEYFAIFPSDYRFEQDELVRMWITEGLIEVKEGKLPEDIGNQYYNDLKGRSLIQENDKMHDIIHHLACIASGKFFYQAESGSSSSCKSPASVRHVSFGGQFNDSRKFELPVDGNSLRTLIRIGGMADISHKKIWSYKMLRVLDFRSVCNLSELPRCIGDMKHLRYINLQSCLLVRDLPDSICMLRHLQVLDLGHCVRLQTLPKDMGSLSNLWYLNLSDTKISSLPESMCALYNLRVLDLSHCRDLEHLPEDIGNLQSLRKLKLWHSSISSVPESILDVLGLQVLEVNPHSSLPAHIGKLTSLEVLIWYPVGKEKGQGINELKDMNRLRGRLRIAKMENIGSVEEALMADLKSKKHTEELEFLWSHSKFGINDAPSNSIVRDGDMEVKIMEALEPHDSLSSLSLFNYGGHKLPFWMSNGCLRNLARLEMVDLHMLERVAGVKFPSLNNLIIVNCPILREVSMTTPKLMRLTLRKCRALKAASMVLLSSLSNNVVTHSIVPQMENLNCDYYYLNYFLRQVQAITIATCSKLKMLRVEVGQDNITSLPRGWPSILRFLEVLQLEDLPPANFQLLANDNQTGFPPSLRELRLVNCPRLTCMPSDLHNFISLRGFFIKNCPSLLSLELHELPVPAHLEALFISNCKNLRTLPDGLCNFTSLVILKLNDCPNLEIRPHDLLPPNLVSLYIRDCCKLEEQLEREDKAEWLSLRC